MTPEEIKKRLQSKLTQDRIGAVQLAAQAEPPHRQALLLMALIDKSPYVAALAAEALGASADDSAALLMTSRFGFLSEDGLTRDTGCHIRSNLAFALGRLQHYPAVDHLRLGIRTVQIEPVGGVPFDTGAHLRANCALALGQIRDPDCVRDIALLLFDRSGAIPGESGPTVKMEPRKAAARALSLTGNIQARLPLTLKLVHPENEAPEVLQECMQALVEMEDPHSVEVLKPYLDHDDIRLMAYAALMIAKTQAPEAAALLGETISRLSGDPLRAVVLALTTLRTPEALEILYALTGSDREAVRLTAIEVLPPNSASRIILEALAAHDPSPHVRASAQAAIQTLGLVTQY